MLVFRKCDRKNSDSKTQKSFCPSEQIASQLKAFLVSNNMRHKQYKLSNVLCSFILNFNKFLPSLHVFLLLESIMYNLMCSQRHEVVHSRVAKRKQLFCLFVCLITGAHTRCFINMHITLFCHNFCIRLCKKCATNNIHTIIKKERYETKNRKLDILYINISGEKRTMKTETVQ